MHEEHQTKSMIRNFKLLDLLPELDPDEQLAVFERIIQSPRPQVRQRALGLGAAILSDSRLLKYLHEEDDVRRNAAVEMLKLRRRRSLQLAVTLLDDENPDVVLQAVVVLSHLRDRKAFEQLVGWIATTFWPPAQVMCLINNYQIPFDTGGLLN